MKLNCAGDLYLLPPFGGRAEAAARASSAADQLRLTCKPCLGSSPRVWVCHGALDGETGVRSVRQISADGTNPHLTRIFLLEPTQLTSDSIQTAVGTGPTQPSSLQPPTKHTVNVDSLASCKTLYMVSTCRSRPIKTLIQQLNITIRPNMFCLNM